ncbi:PP2C family protein-serine/threonine phosphatase [Streptomyces formicae]|uniref:Putative regulatory protein n=1 Tax=Streptomyces formicae TaxID=1616117 RepID=A0A291QIS2_9ACTN|nr:PP2C family protein-serine/threonine phosphatase [Streptomyces formicae]ATL31458.1 putative regulatory protein [Streptomyces formicae]
MHRARPLPGLSELMAEVSLTLAACTRPAEGAPLGGDLYDVVRAPAGPRLILGDVKGHGPAAAPLAEAVRAAFRQAAATEEDPARLARVLDARLAPALGPEDFVSLLVVDLRPDEIHVVNCGHPPPLRIGRRITPLALPHASPPLGLHPDPCVRRVQLRPDQRLLLHTDGLTEARDAEGACFPLDRRALAALTAPTLDEAIDRLLGLLHRHTGHSIPADDLTVLLLQQRGVAAADRVGGGLGGQSRELPNRRR